MWLLLLMLRERVHNKEDGQEKEKEEGEDEQGLLSSSGRSWHGCLLAAGREGRPAAVDDG